MNEETSSRIDDPLNVATDLTDRDALMVCIEPRRYVIIRRDGPQRIQPIQGGWEELCNVQPGDRVIYEGTPTKVKAVTKYS